MQPKTKMSETTKETEPLTPEQEAQLEADKSAALEAAKVERPEDISATEPDSNARLSNRIAELEARIIRMEAVLTVHYRNDMT